MKCFSQSIGPCLVYWSGANISHSPATKEIATESGVARPPPAAPVLTALTGEGLDQSLHPMRNIQGPAARQHTLTVF